MIQGCGVQLTTPATTMCQHDKLCSRILPGVVPPPHRALLVCSCQTSLAPPSKSPLSGPGDKQPLAFFPPHPAPRSRLCPSPPLPPRQLLVSRGFTNVKNVTGGIHAYSMIDPSVPVY
jgi:hypothetical protein